MSVETVEEKGQGLVKEAGQVRGAGLELLTSAPTKVSPANTKGWPFLSDKL